MNENKERHLGSYESLADPLASIIIPVYNGARLIGRTLTSVTRQTYRNLDIVVVDDGSTDDTPAIVAAAATSDPRIRLFRKSNGGVAAARNFGVREARGELIAPLDADDLWHPEKIARQVELMQALSEKVGVIYCWCVDIDEDDLIIPPILKKSAASGNVLAELVAKGNFVENASNPLIKRAQFEAVGGFDEGLHQARGQGCEDWKLYLALAFVSEFAVVPDYLVGYRRYTGSMSMNVATMARSVELVSQWITQKWPEMPRNVKQQMMFHMNCYLAHQSLSSDRLLDALRYQATGLRGWPAASLSNINIKLSARLIARTLGLRWSHVHSRTKSLRFDQFSQSLRTNS